ncbi:MAG: HPt (histidine-containing phosphotransfer) domain-containing protein [Myxococcota bacterium]|jgi:hypothetical protein
MYPLSTISATTPHEVTTRLDELCESLGDEEAVATQAISFLHTLDATMTSIQHGDPTSRKSTAQRLASNADAIGARELGRRCRALMVEDDPQSGLTSNVHAEAEVVREAVQLHLDAQAA